MDGFAALSDSTRRDIVTLLARGEQRASAIATGFEMTAPAISQHLKVLRKAGLVTVEKRGRERVYRLDPAGLAEMERWVARTRRLWNGRLDALQQVLDGEE
ncbi:winged helix-turn-helix transcriptional regulator [Parasphingopyxis algicola]|uniref:ArsR/SmtB family transcription factor n=1 Tax=Parasphingopyxis algicola TaxID=2026624 RepID=UPI0015A2A794|nr:metalloregulator ArsR/SmtB family transcription factor [Parasphingopyxis algicola]QLC26168.1 winged helix-turn-helix transcriptional regulator [Parasphingopyxis algicola]